MGDQELQANLLATLGGELLKLDLGSGLNDVMGVGLPGISVTAGRPAVTVLVFVSASGGYFTFYDCDNTHPVTDPAGAAGKLAAYLWQRCGDER